MKLGFEENQAHYDSGAQNARSLTEHWVSSQMFCPACSSSRLNQFPANQPVADFYCSNCNSQFEVKSKKGKFGKKLANGAYKTKIERLGSRDAPHWILLEYNREELSVDNVQIVPRHFFTSTIVEKRKPLKDTARRAGWIGSNILLNQIPKSGRIDVVRNRLILNASEVRRQFERVAFIQNRPESSKGWLLAIMQIIEKISRTEFELADVYAWEADLQKQFPQNNHVRPKIRQQLQVLRDNNYLEFLGNGRYLLRH